MLFTGSRGSAATGAPGATNSDSESSTAAAAASVAAEDEFKRAARLYRAAVAGEPGPPGVGGRLPTVCPFGAVDVAKHPKLGARYGLLGTGGDGHHHPLPAVMIYHGSSASGWHTAASGGGQGRELGHEALVAELNTSHAAVRSWPRADRRLDRSLGGLVPGPGHSVEVGTAAELQELLGRQPGSASRPTVAGGVVVLATLRAGDRNHTGRAKADFANSPFDLHRRL
eukprot:SAG22_NODE_6864_length_802_cov_1.258890_2_plen_226_part_01